MNAIQASPFDKLVSWICGMRWTVRKWGVRARKEIRARVAKEFFNTADCKAGVWTAEMFIKAYEKVETATQNNLQKNLDKKTKN